MALTAQQEKTLTRIRGEISDIEARMKISHNLGDSNSAQGISTSFQNAEYWRKRLDYLYRQEAQLEAIEAGNTVKQTGINVSNWVAG